jgi:lipase chaperone LimK
MQSAHTSFNQKRLTTIAIVAAVVLIPFSFYFLQPKSKQASFTAPKPTTSTIQPRFGPGILQAQSHPSIAPSDTGRADPGAPPGLAVTPGQLLAHNKEMRDVFDYFLLGGSGAERSVRFERLQAHLKAKLPATAYQEAEQIASNYLRYLDAFEKFTANETLVPKTETTSVPANANELERFNAKVLELSRIRQSILGVKIAQLWFAEEEATMQQSLEDVRQASLHPQ